MSGRTNTTRFRASATSVPAARRHVAVLLEEWKLGGLIDDARLIASELTTNAVQHAKGTGDFFEVELRRRRGLLIIGVSDSFGWQMPEPRVAAPADTDGRGLAVVASLADAWGVRPRASGKTVWAHLKIRREGAPC